MSDEATALSVDELVEYCRTQAGLLAGRSETLGAETDDLLDEIDERIAALRTRLAARTSATVSPSTADSAEIAELEELERDLAERQAVAEARRARMAACRDLSEAYAELASELASDVDEGRAALDRVLRFERDRDAPAHFDDRLTVLEAAESDGDGGE